MTLETNRPKCCCFTGHRENKLKRSEKEILEDLKQAINQAIDDGYTTFIATIEFMITLQPYAAFFTFVFLAIKSLMLIKWR